MEVEPSHQKHIILLLCYSIADEKSGKMVLGMKVSKQKICVIEFIHPETIAPHPIVTHEEQIENVSTVTWWVMYFKDVVV